MSYDNMRFTPTSLTISSGQTESPVLSLDPYGTKYIRDLLIQSPATLPESVSISVSVDGATFATLQSGGSDIIFPAGKATQIVGFMSVACKLVASAAVGANRVFQVSVSSS